MDYSDFGERGVHHSVGGILVQFLLAFTHRGSLSWSLDWPSLQISWRPSAPKGPAFSIWVERALSLWLEDRSRWVRAANIIRIQFVGLFVGWLCVMRKRRRTRSWWPQKNGCKFFKRFYYFFSARSIFRAEWGYSEWVVLGQSWKGTTSTQRTTSHRPTCGQEKANSEQRTSTS